ncbi:hypothetical protein [Bifidobacterium choloepi]|uniref:Uncharacterized protein n=1 Tax=Bifidobacterium choloepi TaxID=2614131 RepID=A0A6I5N179_9BIFI|nr:hypothetical protein [Bifidobacterium choloepi]NEG69885.1 hypothetical protein [Bifidobacterium choloepi]
MTDATDGQPITLDEAREEILEHDEEIVDKNEAYEAQRREERFEYGKKRDERDAHEAHAKTTHAERAEEAAAKEKSDYQTGLAE